MTTNSDLPDITSELHNVTGAGVGSMIFRGARWLGKHAWAALHPTKDRIAGAIVGGGVAAANRRGD